MSQLHFLDESQVKGLRRGYLVTVNMQHLYSAYECPAWRELFFSSPMAHLCVDGRGARSLLQRSEKTSLPIVAGNEALGAALAAAAGEDVLIIGSSAEAVQGTARRYPAVGFQHVGGRFNIADQADARAAATDLVAGLDGDRPLSLVAIALGVGKQELLAEALAPMISAPIYCIGGSVEMLAGSLKRAPVWVQRMGLEAVWRLALQPNTARLERMIKSYGYYVLFRLGVLDLRKVLEWRSA